MPHLRKTGTAHGNGEGGRPMMAKKGLLDASKGSGHCGLRVGVARPSSHIEGGPDSGGEKPAHGNRPARRLPRIGPRCTL